MIRSPILILAAMTMSGCTPAANGSDEAKPRKFEAIAKIADLEGVAETSSYEERDGRAEALADLAKGAPLRLYFYSLGGRAHMWGTPGLVACQPYNPVSSNVFQRLDGADYQEGEVYPANERRQQEAAWTFASAYNQTVFNSRKREVAAACQRPT